MTQTMYANDVDQVHVRTAEPTPASSSGVPASGSADQVRRTAAAWNAAVPKARRCSSLDWLTADYESSRSGSHPLVVALLLAVLALEIMLAAEMWTSYAPMMGVGISPVAGFTGTLVTGLLVSVPILAIICRLRRS